MSKDDLLPRTKYHDQQIDNFAESQSQLLVSSNVEYSTMPRSPRLPRYDINHPNPAFDFYWGRATPNPFSSEPGDLLAAVDLIDEDRANAAHSENLELSENFSYPEHSADRSSFRPYAQYRQSLARSTIRHPHEQLDDHPVHRRPSSRERRSQEIRIINTESITLLSDDHQRSDARSSSGSDPSRSPLLSSTSSASDNVATTSLPHTDSLILEPIARFRIPDSRSRCTITFDSPISACYLYIKFYSSDAKPDIDIQGVYINGFIGPRCFPTINLR